MHTLKCVVEFGVCVLVKGIQVGTDCAGEKNWVLRYDGNATPQVVEANLRDIDAVDVYGTLTCLQEAEKRQCK